MNRFLLLLFFCFAFALSGCLTIFEDIFIRDDGSFLIRTENIIDTAIVSFWYKVANFDDSSQTQTHNPYEKKIKRSDVESLQGFMNYTANDTIIGLAVHHIVEIELNDTGSLHTIHNLIWSGNKDSMASWSKQYGDSVLDAFKNYLNVIPMHIEKTAHGLELGFTPFRALPYNLISGKDANLLSDKETSSFHRMSIQIKELLNMNLRVFSNHLLPATQREIESIPGGQQWRIPFEQQFDLIATETEPVVFRIGVK